MTSVTASNADIYSTPIRSQGMEVTMTLTSQTQTSTSFISRLLAIFDDSDLSVVAVFTTLALVASIYFVNHLPAEAALIAQFP